jgi:hypothetical protein
MSSKILIDCDFVAKEEVESATADLKEEDKPIKDLLEKKIKNDKRGKAALGS